MPLVDLETLQPQITAQTGMTPIDPAQAPDPVANATPEQHARGVGVSGTVRGSIFDQYEAEDEVMARAGNAAFRQGNTVVSTLSHMGFLDGTTNERVPGYNPWDDIHGTPYEDHWEAFTDVGNPQRTQALMRQIDQETADRQTLASSGLTGFLASMTAGTLDPTLLIPVGGELKLAANEGYAISRSALSMAMAAGSGAAMQEVGLQASQITRTPEESAINVGSSIVLGGLLGFGTASLLSQAERASAAAAVRRIQAIATGAEPGAAPHLTATSAGSGGAAAVNDFSNADLTPMGRITRAIANWSQISPNLRLNFSPSSTARQIGQELAETSLMQGMHAQGRSLGASAERAAIVLAHAREGAGLRLHDQIYTEMRKAGGNVGKSEFDNEVGRAMRRADEHPNPYVQRAAAMWRQQVFDPFKDDAIALGMLAPDVGVSEAESYFSRMWNRDRLVAQEGAFKSKAGAFYANTLAEEHASAIETLKNRQAALEAEIADLRLAPDDRTRALSDLEARGKALDTANPDQVTRVSDINAARTRARVAREAGDKAGVAAAAAEVKRIQDEGGDALRNYLAERTKLRTRHKRVDLNYAGLQARADRIAQSLTDLEEANVRTLQRMAERGRKLERDIDHLTPDKFEDQLSKVRGEFNRIIERQNAAEDRLAQLNAEAPDAPLTKAAHAREAQLKPERMRRLAELSDRIQAVEDLSRAWQNASTPMTPAEMQAELKALNDAIESEARQASNVTMARGEKAQRLKDKLSRIDPKRLDERAAALEAMRRRIEVEHNERWATKVEENADGSLNYDAAAKDIVDSIFDKLTGKTGVDATDLPAHLTPIARGPLKDRTFHIPDALVEEFLESNVRTVAARYSRLMAAENELTRKFGRADMRDQITAIQDQYRLIREQVAAAKDGAEARAIMGQHEGMLEHASDGLTKQPTKERLLATLDRREKSDIRDIQAMRDVLRGTYKAAENASSLGLVTRNLTAFNYLRTMGGLVISNLNDLYRPAMVHGLLPYLREGIAPLITNMKAVNLSIKEGQAAGQVLERIAQHRIQTMAELGDPFGHGTATDRFLANMTHVATRWNGIAYFTDCAKALASTMSQNRILRATISGKNPALLAVLGIDTRMAARIAEEFKAHGQVIDGVHVAGTENWADDAAVRAYRNAISADIDTTVVTPTIGDVPLFMHTPLGRLIFQFRRFTFAAHSRVTLRGLQENKMQFLSGMVGMTAVGMMATALRSWRGGDERWHRFLDAASNPGYLVGEGLDMSGVFALPVEIANNVEKLTQATGGYSFNPIKTPLMAAGRATMPGASMEGSSTRFATRGVAGAVLGPSVGLLDTVAKAAGLPSGVTDSRRNAAESLIPYNSYLGFREMLQVLNDDSPYLGSQP